MTGKRKLSQTFLLLAGTMVGSYAAHAQLGYPVSGLYVGLGGGFNIKGSESIKNITPNIPGAGGLSTPNLTTSNGIGGAVVGSVGWGFGNGLRAEIQYDWMSNSFNGVSGISPRNGFGVSTAASGTETLNGPMVNVLYDFAGLVPWFVPYAGVGVGYQWSHLNNFTVGGGGTAAALNPTLSSGDTRAAFAFQGILGAAFPIPQVPGLALTADYRILAMTGTRTYNAGLAATLPVAGRVSRFGTMQIGHEYNNMFTFGIRYNFGVAPPPPPPMPVAAPAPAPARSYLVFFDWDKATLTDRARQIIKEAADNSTHTQYTRIDVNGYTDTSGTPKYNQGLSVRRAQAVEGELVRDGVPQSAITVQGFGDTHLLVPTGQGVREPQNRRVEIIMH